MAKPDEVLANRKNVVEGYLNNNSVLPLMLTHGVGETSGYYYRFISEFVPDLLEAANATPPSNLILDCENKLRALKFIPEIETQLSEVKPAPPPTMLEKAIETWIELWCKTFPCYEIQEHQYRLDQLLEVLPLYQRKDLNSLIEINARIMNTCYHFGSARLAVRFFDSILAATIKSHYSVFSVYLAAIGSNETAYPLNENHRLPKGGYSLEKFEEAKIKPEESGSFMDYQTYFKSCLQPFQQRTFLTEKIGHVVSEEVKIGFAVEKCAKCDKQMPSGESKSEPVKCDQCGEELKSKLRIRIGRPIIYAKGASVFWEEEFSTLKINYLFDAVQKMGVNRCSRSIIDLNSLRKDETVFWNIIWYCRLYGLPYDLFLPYKAATRKSLLLQKKLIKDKPSGKVGEKDTVWFDQFKQIRVFALCTDKDVQTDNEIVPIQKT